MRILTYFITFLLFITFVNSAIYTEEFSLQDNKANVNIEINFDNKQVFNFYLDLPKDVDNVNVLLDSKEKKFEVIKSDLGNLANINGSASQVKINYISKNYVEEAKKNYFTAELTSLLNADLEIKVILPEGATLDKPFINDIKETSVYPQPNDITTNGKNIIITWKYNAKKDQNFPLFIIYNVKSFNYIYLILIAILVVAAVLFLRRKKQVQVKVKKVKVDDIEKHLKDEEKLIVNILKQKQGQCTQATLVTLTNMSKASLSRLLNELEERGIIRKEQQGNKNLIILKKR